MARELELSIDCPCGCGEQTYYHCTYTASRGTPMTRDYPGDAPEIEVESVEESITFACGTVCDLTDDADLTEQMREAAQEDVQASYEARDDF